MKSIYTQSSLAIAAVALVLLSGCSGMTRQEQGIATGAVIGGVPATCCVVASCAPEQAPQSVV